MTLDDVIDSCDVSDMPLLSEYKRLRDENVELRDSYKTLKANYDDTNDERSLMYARMRELEKENARLRDFIHDMSKAFITLDIDRCQSCPRDMACTFIHKSFDTTECAFERDLKEFGIEV